MIPGMKRILLRTLAIPLTILGGLYLAAMFVVSALVLAAIAAAVGGPILVVVVWVCVIIGALRFLALVWNYPSMSPQQQVRVFADMAPVGAISRYLILRFRLLEPRR